MGMVNVTSGAGLSFFLVAPTPEMSGNWEYRVIAQNGIIDGASQLGGTVHFEMIPTSFGPQIKMVGNRTWKCSKGVEFEEEQFEGKYEFLYSAGGTLLQKEEEINVQTLPGPIAQAVTKAYPKAKIKKAEKVMKPDDTVSGYEVEINQEGNDKILPYKKEDPSLYWRSISGSFISASEILVQYQTILPDGNIAWFIVGNIESNNSNMAIKISGVVYYFEPHILEKTSTQGRIEFRRLIDDKLSFPNECR
ncbi:MAG: hypothetical protein ACRERU_22275 [Methylococcales bacterium]